MTTTPETIEELRKLLAEATPGPVSEQPVVSSAEPNTLNWFATSEDYREITGGKGYTPEGFTLTGCIAPADMKCLAAARNSLPTLLSDLEAAQKALAGIRELAENSNKPTYLIEVIASTARHALAATGGE